MVIEPGEDLDVGAVSEAMMGEVGLPGLVGLVGLEPNVGRLWFLLRFRANQPCSFQHPIHSRSRDRDLMMVLEVPDNRVSARVEAA